MRNSWLQLVDSVLCPERPQLERCLRERDRYLDARRAFAEERARAVAHCERQIELAREAVFKANDGVVAWRMTSLEREWRRLSRRDPDAGLMDLWARIAPAAWFDRKRWRDSDASTQLETAVLLAADPDGVEAAESAIRSLRGALEAWGCPVGARIRWRSFEHDSDPTTELLAEPLRVARAAIAASDMEPVVLERAAYLEHDVREALCARFPERALLARSVAHAASVDLMWRAAALSSRPNLVTPLRELWSTGYAVSAVADSGVTLEIPSASH